MDGLNKFLFSSTTRQIVEITVAVRNGPSTFGRKPGVGIYVGVVARGGGVDFNSCTVLCIRIVSLYWSLDGLYSFIYILFVLFNASSFYCRQLYQNLFVSLTWKKGNCLKSYKIHISISLNCLLFYVLIDSTFFRHLPALQCPYLSVVHILIITLQLLYLKSIMALNLSI